MDIPVANGIRCVQAAIHRAECVLLQHADRHGLVLDAEEGDLRAGHEVRVCGECSGHEDDTRRMTAKEKKVTSYISDGKLCSNNRE